MPRAVRYRVLKKIAHGGMAEIFLALQAGAEGFQKPVVLKRILPQLAADPSFVGMLVDEAHIASTLNHSNLVQVLDLGKSGDQFFLVLEFVDGWSLEQVRRRAQKVRMKLPLHLSLYVVGALCRALAYVHTRKRDGKPLGIVHRDVTPQNVLLSREGEVKLADFGIAKAIGKREKSATGVIKGKFAYMSPEQSIGLELDARSDLFSVGTLLYILATGKKPFEGATDLDVLMQVRKARFEKPSTLVKDFNLDVERFILRAMRSDLSRRWQTAEQMADRIDAIQVKLGTATGAAALKRWLENLATRDGVQPPAEVLEGDAGTGTIEIGSRDLELHDVDPVPDHDDEGPTGARPAPRAEVSHADSASIEIILGNPAPAASAQVVAPEPVVTRGTVRSTGAARLAAARAEPASPTPAPLEPAAREPIRLEPVRAEPVRSEPARRGREAQAAGVAAVATASAAPVAKAAALGKAAMGKAPAPRLSFLARVRRFIRRLTLATLFLLVALGTGAYFARPYLPAWLVQPVEAWLSRLPPPIGVGEFNR